MLHELRHSAGDVAGLIAMSLAAAAAADGIYGRGGHRHPLKLEGVGPSIALGKAVSALSKARDGALLLTRLLTNRTDPRGFRERQRAPLRQIWLNHATERTARYSADGCGVTPVIVRPRPRRRQKQLPIDRQPCVT